MTEETGKWFVSQGTLGVFCLLFLGAIVGLFKLYQKVQEARIQEQKDSGKLALQMAERLAPLVERLLDRDDPYRGDPRPRP